MGSLTRQNNDPLVRIKRHPKSDEVSDPIWRIVSEYLDGRRIAQASASTRGVLCMLAWGIARPYGGRDAALRVLGIALLSTSLGENKYSRGLSGKERRIEAGYAGAINDKIVGRL